MTVGTSIGDAREACAERFAANLSVASMPFALQGESFAPPTKGQWARFSVLQSPTPQVTLGEPGNRKYTRRAHVFVQLYDQTDRGGMKTLDALANQVLKTFEGVRFSNLRFFAGVAREGPQDGKWTQMIVDVPFDFQEVK